MQVDILRMYCSNCAPSQYILISRCLVVITADLRKDEYVFVTTCPICDKSIINSRPMN